MNTVDALKDLYKTLCGKDYAGDPNPTDAEMIKAIAKDATTGGGGSGGGTTRIIDLTTLEPRREVDPENDETFIYYFSGYEAGLSPSDFINAWLTRSGGRSASVLNIDEDDDEISLEFSESTKPSPVLNYIPETGEFYYVQQGGGGGGK